MQHVPTWPAISARIDATGTGIISLNGTEHPVEADSAENARREVVRFCAETAQKLQRAVRVTVEEPDATWPLIVHPDGKVDSVDDDSGIEEATEAAFPGGVTGVIDEVPGAGQRDAAAGGPRRTSHLPVVDAEPDADAGLDAAATQDAARAELPDDDTRPVGPRRTGSDPSSAGDADLTVPPMPPAPDVPPASTSADAGLPAEPTPLSFAQPEAPEPAMPAARPVAQQSRRSFIAPERVEEPATRGWRGALARAGVRMKPSAEERSEREDQVAVSQHWPGPRTIAVVNGKGGANKTPTTILTAAVFARYGGAGVLAWDNNQTRGTLGWRTEQGPHDATLHDLLPETERLLSSNAQSAELARFVHHQSRDHYDVLRSQPMALASQQRVSSQDVDRVHAVAAKYYRLIVMDSGNDESDPMWLRMIDHTDQLVVATSSRAEHAEAGALLLEALADRDERSRRLAENAVAVVSQSDEKASAAEVRRIEGGYAELVREVVRIPYDPAMGAAQLHFRALNTATQRAWLSAASAIARGLPEA